MVSKVHLTNKDIHQLARTLNSSIQALVAQNKGLGFFRVYPIPRGGVPTAYALSAHYPYMVVDSPEEADFFVDDIIDSGSTMREWCENYPEKPFFALIDKTDEECEYSDDWVVFPWESKGEEDGKDIDFEHTITRLLQHIGEDPTREGLTETPKRVAKAWKHWTKGYDENPAEILKVFEDGAENCDEMVVVKNIPFFSHCEHHLAPIFGTATISYIPNGKIVGLSKLSRLLDTFARRLQVQERLTNQVADSLMEHLEARGVGVVIQARHLCMESRGISQQGHFTITSALRGVMKEQPETRAEFMSLAK